MVSTRRRSTIDLLKETFGNRIVSFWTRELASKIVRFNAARLFSVWICEVAGLNRQSKRLTDNIRRVITDIRPQMLEKVIENWTSRLDYIRASRGGHMPEVIFKL